MMKVPTVFGLVALCLLGTAIPRVYSACSGRLNFDIRSYNNKAVLADCVLAFGCVFFSGDRYFLPV
jgi:hypothetical protein